VSQGQAESVRMASVRSPNKLVPRTSGSLTHHTQQFIWFCRKVWDLNLTGTNYCKV